MNTVRECQAVMRMAATVGEWGEYFAARSRWAELERDALPPAAPPPEHSTRDPAPLDLPWPASLRSLMTSATAAGWDARSGYSRAWRAGVGRGVFALHHYARIQARRGGREFWVMWRAKADAPSFTWVTDGAMLDWRKSGYREIVNDLRNQGS